MNLGFSGHDAAEVAYFLRTTVRGRGLATRAVLLTADWGFRERHVARIQLRVDPQTRRPSRSPNGPASPSRVVERSSAAYPGGRRFDSRVYSLLPADRVAVRTATLADVEWTEQQVRGEVPDSTTSVVTAYGVDVGRLRVVRTAELVELAGLQLPPAHQGRGLGTRIIHDLMTEAASSGRGFGLSVENDNPRARALYDRLGLVVVGEDGDDHVMRLPRIDLA